MLLSNLFTVIIAALVVGNIFGHIVHRFGHWFEADTFDAVKSLFAKDSGYELPLLSWSKSKLEKPYATVELLTVVFWTMFYAIWSLKEPVNPSLFILYAALTPPLIALALIDIKTQYLPDRILLTMLWGVMFIAAIDLVAIDLHKYVVGATVGYGFLWLIAKMFGLFKGVDAMGYGDFKLFALAAALFGFDAIIVMLIASVLFVAASIGAKWSKGQIESSGSFGQFLVIGMIPVMAANLFYGHAWLN